MKNSSLSSYGTLDTLSSTTTRSLTKRELKRQIYKFLKDKNRGISINLFAELCGISRSMMFDVFFYQTVPLTEHIQRRVNKGFKAWQNGEVAIMQNRDLTKFVTYRKEAKPKLVRQTGLQVVNGEIKIKVGIVNRSDYSGKSLDEALNGG